MANPFGDTEVTQTLNPFGDKEVSGNPFGDSLVAGDEEKKPEGVLGYGKEIIKRTWDTATSVLPERPVDRLALSAVAAVQEPEKLYLDNPDNLAAQNSPEAQQRLRQLDAERKIRKGLQKEISDKDTTLPAQLVGGALDSFAPTLAGAAAALGGAPFAPALAVGLGVNMLTETASEFGERRDLGQSKDDAMWGAAKHGAVATGLEAVPGAVALKWLKNPAAQSGAKTLVKYGAGEAVQEGLTQAYDEYAHTTEGLQPYDLGQSMKNIGMAAATGAVMAPMMAPFAQARIRAHEWRNEKIMKQAMDQLVGDMTGATDPAQREEMVGQIIDYFKTQQFDPEEAARQRDAMAGKFKDVPNTQFGEMLGAVLDNASWAHKAPDEGGISTTVDVRRQTYLERGLQDSTPFAQRVIVGQNNPDAVGLMLGQLDSLPAGSVTAISGSALAEESLFPLASLEAARKSIEAIAKIVGITQPILVTAEQLAGNEMGRYSRFELPNKQTVHVINPREIPSLKHGGNQVTMVEMVYGMTHEIGHALRYERLMTGIQEKGLAAGMDQGTLDLFTHELEQAISSKMLTPEALINLRQFAPEEADLMANWMATVAKVKTGKMTGKELADMWLGPRKFALGMTKEKATKSIYDWVQREARTKLGINKPIDAMTAEEVMHAVTGDPEYFLEFDEFMAEQFSRAAHERNYLAGTPLGQWFQGALTKLREFFGMMKDQGFIKPQVEFNTWLDEQTLRGQAIAKANSRKRTWGHVKLAANMKKAQKAQRAAREAERAALAVEGEAEVETAELLEEEEVAIEVDPQTNMLQKTLDILEFGYSEKQLKPIREMIAKGKIAQAKQAIAELTGEKTHLDKVYVTQAIKELPNKEMLQRETVKAVLGQQKMRKNDKAAWDRLAEKYPEGKIPREAVVDEILKANVPLTITESKTWADYGLYNIGWMGDAYAAEKGLNYHTSTNMWEAPFEINDNNHFRNPKYVAHTRVRRVGDTYWIFELQSDLLQKQSRANLEQKLADANEQLKKTELALQMYEGYVAKDHSQGKMESSWERLVKRYTLILQEERIARDSLQARLDGNIPAEETQTVEAVGKQDWWQRILKEELAHAAELGMSRINFAAPETMATIEGWPKHIQPGTHQLNINVPHSLFGRDTNVTWTFTQPEPDGLRTESPTVEAHFNGRQLTSFFSHDFLIYTEDLDSQRGTDYSAQFGQALQALPKHYGDMQGIFNRYQKDIVPWLEKNFGAEYIEEVEGEPTSGWYSFSVPKAAREITLWDKGNPVSPTYPQLKIAALAGMEEVNATPEQIREAMDLWARFGTESPRFKSWWREGKLVDGITGEPLLLYHGSGLIVPFFDPTLTNWENAFFFADTSTNATWYMNKTMIGRNSSVGIMRHFKDKRRAQEIRQQIKKLKSVMYNNEVPNWDHIKELRNELDEMEVTVDYDSPTPTLGTYYVRMENPMEFDFEGADWVRGAYDPLISEAKTLGHDGLIIRNVKDPLLGTVYLAFSPEQIKDAGNNTGWFGPTDLTLWDKSSPVQSTLAQTTSMLEKVAGVPGISHLIHGWQRTSDALVQLQQRAYQPLPDGSQDAPMIDMLNKASRAEAFKNSLQFHGEQLVKAMWTRSPKELDKIYRVLEAEWLSGELAFDLIGYDNLPTLGGEIIWGKLPDGGMDVTAATGKLVRYWGLAPTGKFEALLAKEGISLDTPQGRELAQMVVDIKLAMMEQFTALERVLQQKIIDRWGGAPMVASQELEQLYQVMQKIRSTPFFPQGRYGNWVISVQEKKDNPKWGERKYKLTRVEHYQSKTSMQKALRAWHELANRTPGKYKISMKPLDELRGIPLQLPANLLDQLAKADIFTENELEILQDFMVPVGHEKIETRYKSWNEKLLGGDKDIVRNFSNFTWHNANYIWKLKFRNEFGKSITAQRKLYNDAQKVYTPEGRAQADKLLRNMQIMSRVKEAILHPQYEFQGLRQAVSLVYLAYNIKTAAMNISTMINTYSAITMEYGELAGHKFYAKGLFDTSRLFSLLKDKQTGELSAKDSEVVWAYERAVREGLIDQSFAFFLAGQANMATDFKGFRKGYFAKLSYGAQHVGMFPFRMVEKANRVGTLLMFFEAERARGAGIEDAYQAAAMRTDLLQNAYNQANRSELFRGKKALLTMFMSYIQFMTWNVAGGYAKAVRTDLTARGLEAQHLGGAQAYSVKLLLIYMLLGGMFAGPGFEDVMEVISWIWRKIFKTNAREELRDFIKDTIGHEDLVMHGVLSNVAGMDLSASFSLGRMVPGVQLLNKNFDNASEFFGAMATKMAGPFGGFTEDMVNVMTKMDAVLRGGARASEVLKEMPGEIGALGRAWDAYTLQQLNPDAGMGVLDKKGARVVEDPPRSGNFRDLTNWELIGTALGGNPAVLSRSRELRYHELGEQIYWRTKQTQLLDARWKAIRTNNEDLMAETSKNIEKFNDSLPDTHSSLRITGKMMAESLRTHRKSVLRDEAGKVQKRYQPIINDMRD